MTNQTTNKIEIRIDSLVDRSVYLNGKQIAWICKANRGLGWKLRLTGFVGTNLFRYFNEAKNQVQVFVESGIFTD